MATSKSSKSTHDALPVIGNSVKIKVAGIPHVPAKVDTGATISSIWASDIRLTPDNRLEFSLFAPESPLYTGERLSADDFKVRNVRNSTGHETIRYLVTIPTVVKGKKIRISYTLADRSRNDFPVLIGRRALNGKFLVDVSKLGVPYPPRLVNSLLNQELKADPQKFHQKYMEKTTVPTANTTPAKTTSIAQATTANATANNAQTKSAKLLYTTHADTSLDFFLQAGWAVRFYDEPIVPHPADLVYFRDPFNDPEYQPDPFHIDQLIAQHQDAQIVDRITSFQDILELEDKYLQSGAYEDLYPATWLPSQHEFVPGSNLAKPRISQRAKNILFNLEGRTLDDSWIIQELLDIQEELRVYVVCGDILDQASIKSSKASGKVKIIGDRPLTPEEIIFVHQALEKCPLDVVGFDIAVLPGGQYKVIEANRSPQFLRYSERTGINLAALITKHYQP